MGQDPQKANDPESIRITTLITRVKKLYLNGLNPNNVIKRYYPEYSKYSYPEKWMQLYDIKKNKDKIDYIENVIEYLEKKKADEKKEIEKKMGIQRNEEEKPEERKNNIFADIKELKHLNISDYKIKNNKDYYIDNYELLKTINTIIDDAKEGRFYKKSKPGKIYEKTEKFAVNKWEGLIELEKKSEYFHINELLIATRIEMLKRQLPFYDKDLNYDYYDKTITKDNYHIYQNKYEENKDKIKMLHQIKHDNDYIYKNSNFKSLDFYEKKLDEYEKLNLDCNTDFYTIQKYENLFKEEKQKVINNIKEHKKKEKEEEEERENYSSYNSSPNYSSSNYSSSSSSRNDDMKKAYVKLCQNCKNSCVGCQTKIVGTPGVTRGFGLHKSCQSSSCYICGKSSNVQERNTSHLCKSCYHSNKFDVAKCLDCKKQFK